VIFVNKLINLGEEITEEDFGKLEQFWKAINHKKLRLIAGSIS
jgi:hypothetical protein